MNNPLKTSQVLSVTLLLARLPIGIFFLIAGYAKLAKMGIHTFVADYQPMAERFMSPSLANTFLHALPWVEMAVGVALVVGLYTRVAATVASLLLISFIIAITGLAFNATGGKPLDPNVVFLGLTLLLMATGGGEIAVDHTFKFAPGPMPH